MLFVNTLTAMHKMMQSCSLIVVGKIGIGSQL